MCQLTNGEQPYWLHGIVEMTRTFGLELLESVLKGYPNIFLKVKLLLVCSSLGSKNSRGKIHVIFIFYLYCCKVKTQKNEWFPDWNLEVVVFKERGTVEFPEKNLSEQGREPAINLIHLWHRCQDSNLGLTSGRRVLSPWRQPCSSLASKIVWAFC